MAPPTSSRPPTWMPSSTNCWTGPSTSTWPAMTRSTFRMQPSSAKRSFACCSIASSCGNGVSRPSAATCPSWRASRRSAAGFVGPNTAASPVWISRIGCRLPQRSSRLSSGTPTSIPSPPPKPLPDRRRARRGSRAVRGRVRLTVLVSEAAGTAFPEAEAGTRRDWRETSARSGKGRPHVLSMQRPPIPSQP